MLKDGRSGGLGLESGLGSGVRGQGKEPVNAFVHEPWLHCCILKIYSKRMSNEVLLPLSSPAICLGLH